MCWGGGHPLAYHSFHTHIRFGNIPQPQNFCFLWGPDSSSAPSQSQRQGWCVRGFSLAQRHSWQFMVFNPSVDASVDPSVDPIVGKWEYLCHPAVGGGGW